MDKFYEKQIEQIYEERLYFNQLEKFLQELSKDISSNRIKIIINFIKQQFPKITFDNNDNNYKNKIFRFLNEINNSQEAFYFLKQQKHDGIKDLKDFYLDSDENELLLSDVDEFIEVVSFLNNDINPIKSSFLLVKTFVNGILDEEKFGYYFNVIRKYNIIKSLFEKFLKKEKGVFTTIRDIMKDSVLYIQINHMKKEYEIEGSYHKLNNDNFEMQIKINSEQLDDLYQRVFISLNIVRKDASIQKFIQIYREIKKINNLINTLFIVYGYPDKIHIEFKLQNNNLNCFYDMKEYNLKNL